MEIRYIIPDELIENYRQDELYRIMINYDLHLLRIPIRKVAGALKHSNYRLAWLSKRKQRIKADILPLLIKEDFFLIKTALEEAKKLEKELKTHIKAAEQANKHEIVQFHISNIKPIVEAIIKKLESLLASLKSAKDFSKIEKEIEKTKHEVSKELYKLDMILDSTLEILRRV